MPLPPTTTSRRVIPPAPPVWGAGGDGAAPPRRKRSRWKRVLGWAVALLVLVPLVGAFALYLYARSLEPELPAYDQLTNPDLALSSVAYTADGQFLARYHRHNRTWVTLGQMAPALVEGTIATEDKRFYEHHGVDWRRFFGSAYLTLRGQTQGGSTITMQLARNLFPDDIGNAVSARRKIKEVMTAWTLEKTYDKPRILEMYLNTMGFGYNTYGVEAASQVFFSKSAHDLTVPEAAMLVGMLKGATRYNPRTNADAATERRNLVLTRMAETGKLTFPQAQAYAAEPIQLQFKTPDNRIDSPAPYFADYVAQWVQAWCQENGCDLYNDGLKIYTTLDTRVQAVALESVLPEAEGLQSVANYEWSRAGAGVVGSAESAEALVGRGQAFAYFWNSQKSIVDGYVRDTDRYKSLVASGTVADAALRQLRADGSFMDSLKAIRTKLEVGLVAIEPETGYVRAWVGGRDYAEDQYDHVATAKRQPGSTFKAFVYAAAVDWGYRPDDTFRDEARTYRFNGETWTPHNSGGGSSGASMTLRQALTYSKNTIAARITNEIGPGYVARIARRMGITSELREVPSLGLGTSEVTLLELVSGYTTLAANGMHTPPIVVTRIEDRNGNVLATFDPRPTRVLGQNTAYTTLDMMRDVIDKGTGRALRASYGLQGDIAGKTGTTQQNADGWFVAMTPRLVVGSWVGFNDRRIAFRSMHWGQGGRGALSLVGSFLAAAKRSGTVALPDSERFAEPSGYSDYTQQPSWFDAPEDAEPDAHPAADGSRSAPDNADPAVSRPSAAEDSRQAPSATDIGPADPAAPRKPAGEPLPSSPLDAPASPPLVTPKTKAKTPPSQTEPVRRRGQNSTGW